MATPFVLLSPVPNLQMVTVPQPLEIFQRKKIIFTATQIPKESNFGNNLFDSTIILGGSVSFSYNSRWRFQLFFFDFHPEPWRNDRI